MAQITMRGNETNTVGELPAVGTPAPDFTLAGADYGAVVAWFGSTLNAGLLAVTAVVFCLFASLAWKVILEDYVPQAGARRALVLLVNLICLVLAAAGVFFITRMALGSAPLPAGFGA